MTLSWVLMGNDRENKKYNYFEMGFSWCHQTKRSNTFNHWTNPLENNITLIYIFFLWKWIRSFSCSILSTGILLLFAKENVNEKYSASDQCVNQPKIDTKMNEIEIGWLTHWTVDTLVMQCYPTQSLCSTFFNLNEIHLIISAN